MDKIKELLKRSFEIWVEKRRLKEIDKAADEYQKAHLEAERKYFVLKKLCEGYNELYGRNLMVKR